MLNIKTAQNLPILTYFVLGLFFIEFIATIFLFVFGFDKIRFVGVYKLILEGVLLLSIRLDKLPKTTLYCLAFIVITYIINQFLSPIFLNRLGFHFSKGSIYYLNRFLFIFVFILAFFSIENKKQVARTSVNLIGKILFLNTFLIIFGVISDFEVFKSYPYSLRFGSDGLFNKVNEVSYLYIIYIITLYYSYLHKKTPLWKLLYVALASLLLGTKIIIFFLVAVCVVHFLFINKYKGTFRIIAIPIIFLFICYFNEILEFIFGVSPFWSDLRTQYSLKTLIFSTRNLLAFSNYEYIVNNWALTNYLVGGPFYSIDFTRTRMDILDLFIHFGLLPTIIYLFLISKYFIYKNRQILNTLCGLLILSGFLAGGLFLRVSAIIYMFLALYNLNDRYKEQNI